MVYRVLRNAPIDHYRRRATRNKAEEVIGVSLIALLSLIEASRAIWSRSKEKCTSCNVGWSDGTRARGLLRDRAEVCWEFQVAVKTAADRAN